jgi:hypothetical protein
MEDKVTLGRISPRVLWFSFVSIIPPMAYTHHHFNIILVGRASGRSLEDLKMSRISGSNGGKRTIEFFQSGFLHSGNSNSAAVEENSPKSRSCYFVDKVT